MDILEIGGAIRYLRKKAGFTQKRLAELLNVSDKAVSKWERGLSCPDISLLPKMAIFLDTDIESLLYGHRFHHKESWCGILTIGIHGRINSGTLIYDKPLVYYLISNFLLLGIKDVIIFGDTDDAERILGDGSRLGVNLVYKKKYEQDPMIDFEWLEENIGDRNIAVFNGYAIVYGTDYTRICQRVMSNLHGATILAVHGKLDEKEIIFDYRRKVVEDESTRYSEDHYYPIPFLFCSLDVWKKIGTGCFEEIIKKLQSLEMLNVELMGRGMHRFNLRTCGDVLEAAQFIKMTQEKLGEQVACLEEIAWRRGLISRTKMREYGKEIANLGNAEYGNYILSL